jgi:hypothetical protein
MIKGIKLQTFLKDISDIANYYRLTKATQMINLVISVVYNFLILLLIAGTIYSVFLSGTSIFGDKQDLTRRFECKSPTFNDVVKTYEEAKAFVDMYKGNCYLYHISTEPQVQQPAQEEPILPRIPN